MRESRPPITLDQIEAALILPDPGSLAERIIARIQDLNQQPDLPILLVAQDPRFFLSGLFAALIIQRPIFIGNPAWAVQEWQQVQQILPPVWLWSDQSLELPLFSQNDHTQPGWIMIPTGGSSGQIRFAIHTLETIKAAVIQFQSGYGLNVIDCLNGLPLFHVSGFMPIFRSLFTGGTVQFLQAWRDLSTLNPDTLSHRILSLVPTQLQHFLESNSGIKQLQSLRLILLGGAPSWHRLLTQARNLNIPLSPCYGMTETLGLIASISPEKFLAGESGFYQLLPGVEVAIVDPDQAGIGQIQLTTAALTLGYYPHVFDRQTLLTGDLGQLNNNHNLAIKGRQNRLIITGGEKVLAEEVEAVILQTGLVRDVFVLGVTDATWGEIVKAVYVPAGPGVTPHQLEQAIATQLSRYKHPKQWQAVNRLSRTPQGKLIYGANFPN